MKVSIILKHLQFLFCLSLIFTSCQKEEQSDYIQQYLDALAIQDTIPVDLDVPCALPENSISYYTYNYNFIETTCSDNGDEGFQLKAYNLSNDIYLYLTFKDRPAAGKYVTEHDSWNAPYYENEVVMEYYTNYDDFVALDDDTIYVEKLSGGMYVFSFCNVQIDAGWGGYYASGNFQLELTDCD